MSHALLLAGSLASALLSGQDPIPPTAQDPASPAAQDPASPAAQDPADESESPLFELAPEHVLQEEQYFGICDHDGDGVIVFAEARHSLELTRASFAVYDTDRSGDISRDEFRERYTQIIARYAGFAPPIPSALTVLPPEQTPQQMLNRWDDDSNRGLDAREVQAMLDRYDMDEYTGEQAIQLLDRNGSRRLEVSELLPLKNLVDDHTNPDWIFPEEPEAMTLIGLFGTQVPRPGLPGAVPMPPLTLGPLPHFHRLDLDRDGGISLEDLTELQTPIQISVRPSTVINVLDRDGDGKLSAAELRAALD